MSFVFNGSVFSRCISIKHNNKKKKKHLRTVSLYISADHIYTPLPVIAKKVIAGKPLLYINLHNTDRELLFCLTCTRLVLQIEGNVFSCGE